MPWPQHQLPGELRQTRLPSPHRVMRCSQSCLLTMIYHPIGAAGEERGGHYEYFCRDNRCKLGLSLTNQDIWSPQITDYLKCFRKMPPAATPTPAFQPKLASFTVLLGCPQHKFSGNKNVDFFQTPVFSLLPPRPEVLPLAEVNINPGSLMAPSFSQ